MELIIYGMIFIIGTLFGSFFTLAVYRIPLGLDITHEHSFCPNCNNKLHLRDLIPVLSYIMLGGKCRYCGKKVRIRYLLLELLSGFVFLMFALSIKLDLYNINANQIIYFLFFVLYFATLFIIAGIDKEKVVIQKSVLLFSQIIGICFMIYVCISKGQVIYTYIICLAIACILLMANTIFIKNNLYDNYTISVLVLCLYMIVFTGTEVFYYSVAICLSGIGIDMLVNKVKTLAKRKVVVNTDRNSLRLPIGFYLIVSNIFVLIASNFLC